MGGGAGWRAYGNGKISVLFEAVFEAAGGAGAGAGGAELYSGQCNMGRAR
jgi:hypothetical protein